LFFSSDNIILPLGGVGAGALVGDVKRGLWGRQASHDGLNEVGDLIWRRCRLRPQCDNPVESFGARVEGDDAVIGFNEAPSHRKTHVARPINPMSTVACLALVDFPLAPRQKLMTRLSLC
jgi:hypothetical protein